MSNLSAKILHDNFCYKFIFIDLQARRSMNVYSVVTNTDNESQNHRGVVCNNVVKFPMKENWLQ